MRWWARFALAAAAMILLAAIWMAWLVRDLPATGEIRARLFVEPAPRDHGSWEPLWAIAPELQSAVVIWEDPAFYHHSGLDYSEIARAARIDLLSGSYRRGASTITQQVAKNLFLTSEKTMTRKIREAILARRIERALSKDEILTVYLNIAEWGNGIVGAEQASRRYFNKPASDLDWAEAAMLAGILPNPRLWNPCIDPARASQARHVVLTKLLSSQSISQQEFREADSAPRGGCHASVAPTPAIGK